MADGVRPPVPRWVKGLVVVALVVAVLLLVSTLSGVRHGPGRHAPAGLGPSTATAVAG